MQVFSGAIRSSRLESVLESARREGYDSSALPERDVAHDVFISHAREDKTIADAVCATLEQEGIRCWIAPRDIRPGAEWSESIIDGIRRARMFVLVFSGRANASGHVRREVERAVSHGLIVIPFRVEDVLPEGALEYHLGAVHWLDAMTPPLDTHIKRLAETARSIIAADATVDLASPPRVDQPAGVPTRTIAELPRPAERPSAPMPVRPQPIEVATPPAVGIESYDSLPSSTELPAATPRFTVEPVVETTPPEETGHAAPATPLTFASLIGSSGSRIGWSRACNFLIALVVADISVRATFGVFYGFQANSGQLSSLLGSVVEALVAVVVFRHVPPAARALVIAVVMVSWRAFWFRTFAPDYWVTVFWWYPLTFTATQAVVFYIVVPLAIGRLRATAAALCLGAAAAGITSSIVTGLLGESMPSGIPLLANAVIGPVAFAFAFVTGLRLIGGTSNPDQEYGAASLPGTRLGPE